MRNPLRQVGRPLCKAFRIAASFLFIFTLVLLNNATAFADTITQDDLYSVRTDTPWYDPNAEACDSNTSSSATTSVDASSNNVKVAYQFFVANGFSSVQSAGIVGNLMEESTDQLSPTALNSIGAYGIAQWRLGRLTELRTWVTAAGGDPATLGGQTGKPVGQLEFIIHELNTSYTSVRDAVKKDTALSDVVHEWNVYYEVSGAPDAPRLDNANAVLNEPYAGEGSGATGSASSGNCASATLSSETCNASATGDAKILAAAECYKGIFYQWGGGPHGDGGYTAFRQGCPLTASSKEYSLQNAAQRTSIADPGKCATDCSGLVSASVDQAFGLNLGWSIQGTMVGSVPKTGGSYWKPISMDNLQPGDIVTTSEHVEIVRSESNGWIHTFGSHQTGEKTGDSQATIGGYYTAAYRWNGPTGGNGGAPL